MKLKRLYHRIKDSAGEYRTDFVRGPDGDYEIDPLTSMARKRLMIERDVEGLPIVRGVVVQTMPRNGVKHFTERFCNQGFAEGWISYADNRIIIHCEERGELSFLIKTRPDRFCTICGEVLPGIKADRTGTAARAHMKAEHPGEPDQYGYVVRNYYGTELEA